MKILKTNIILFNLIFILFVSDAKSAEIAFCTGIADGDTLFVKIGAKNEKVRLIGIDTPEKEGPYTKEEYFGREASKFTEERVKGKEIRLEFDQERRDDYGRLLAYVYLPDGTLLNEELIKKGYARAYRVFKYRQKAIFIKEETMAKKECLGIWKKNCPKKLKIKLDKIRRRDIYCPCDTSLGLFLLHKNSISF